MPSDNLAAVTFYKTVYVGFGESWAPCAIELNFYPNRGSNYKDDTFVCWASAMRGNVVNYSTATVTQLTNPAYITSGVYGLLTIDNIVYLYYQSYSAVRVWKTVAPYSSWTELVNYSWSVSSVALPYAFVGESDALALIRYNTSTLLYTEIIDSGKPNIARGYAKSGVANDDLSYIYMFGLFPITGAKYTYCCRVSGVWYPDEADIYVAANYPDLLPAGFAPSVSMPDDVANWPYQTAIAGNTAYLVSFGTLSSAFYCVLCTLTGTSVAHTDLTSVIDSAKSWFRLSADGDGVYCFWIESSGLYFYELGASVLNYSITDVLTGLAIPYDYFSVLTLECVGNTAVVAIRVTKLDTTNTLVLLSFDGESLTGYDIGAYPSYPEYSRIGINNE